MPYASGNDTAGYTEHHLSLTPGSYLGIDQNGLLAPIPSIPWTSLSATPTTLGGYGITDAATAAALAESSNATAAALTLKAPIDSPAFTGNLTAPQISTTRIDIGAPGIGWRYNPASGGQTEIVFPGGTAALYQSGNPTRPVLYFPGTIVAEAVLGQTSAVTITGTLPSSAIEPALATMSNWLPTNALSNGVAYAATGDFGSNEPIPILTYYYPVAYVNDGGELSSNSLAYKWRSPAQLRTDLLPTATATLDWPSIPASSTSTLTLPLTAATTTGTPTIALGWSASLPAGITVSQSWVSANGTVSITLANLTPAPIDPPPITLRATLIAY